MCIFTFSKIQNKCILSNGTYICMYICKYLSDVVKVHRVSCAPSCQISYLRFGIYCAYEVDNEGGGTTGSGMQLFKRCRQIRKIDLVALLVLTNPLVTFERWLITYIWSFFIQNLLKPVQQIFSIELLLPNYCSIVPICTCFVCDIVATLC